LGATTHHFTDFHLFISLDFCNQYSDATQQLLSDEKLTNYQSRFSRFWTKTEDEKWSVFLVSYIHQSSEFLVSYMKKRALFFL